MSQEPPAPETWPPLSPLERRVLGVLVEKQKTSKSPDAYPMSLNALTTGCNQKSNRDPVLELDEDEVEETLGQLQRRGVVSKLVGGRVDRWRHLLYEAWRVSKVELAILAELVLRGPQTEGDLRGRASRMDDIADVDALRAALKPLADRKLVVYLSPPDRRGTTLTHGFHPPAELEAAKTRFAAGAPEPEPAVRQVAGGLEAKLATACEDIENLKRELAELKNEVRKLRDR